MLTSLAEALIQEGQRLSHSFRAFSNKKHLKELVREQKIIKTVA
jgi:hypothetical protein